MATSSSKIIDKTVRDLSGNPSLRCGDSTKLSVPARASRPVITTENFTLRDNAI